MATLTIDKELVKMAFGVHGGGWKVCTPYASDGETTVDDGIRADGFGFSMTLEDGVVFCTVTGKMNVTAAKSLANAIANLQETYDKFVGEI